MPFRLRYRALSVAADGGWSAVRTQLWTKIIEEGYSPDGKQLTICALNRKRWRSGPAHACKKFPTQRREARCCTGWRIWTDSWEMSLPVIHRRLGRGRDGDERRRKRKREAAQPPPQPDSGESFHHASEYDSPLPRWRESRPRFGSRAR